MRAVGLKRLLVSNSGFFLPLVDHNLNFRKPARNFDANALFCCCFAAGCCFRGSHTPCSRRKALLDALVGTLETAAGCARSSSVPFVRFPRRISRGSACHSTKVRYSQQSLSGWCSLAPSSPRREPAEFESLFIHSQYGRPAPTLPRATGGRIILLRNDSRGANPIDPKRKICSKQSASTRSSALSKQSASTRSRALSTSYAISFPFHPTPLSERSVSTAKTTTNDAASNCS